MISSIKRWLWRTSMRGLDKGPHITRYYMYNALGRQSDKIGAKSGNVLSISHSESLMRVLGITPTSLVQANYPEHNMLALSFDNDQFDYVVSDQVLEHLEGDPFIAIKECQRVLKKGGFAIHTTCFINPVHKTPNDYWRFTPDALSLMHKDWHSIIDSSGWGNFKAWSYILEGMRFDGIPHAKWHPLHKLANYNDKYWPIVTWIIAQK